MTARTAADLVGVNKTTAAYFYHRLREIIAWQQDELFPALAEELGALSERHRQVVRVLDLVRPEAFIGPAHGAVGRPKKDRAALARSFLAQAVFNISETEVPVERLRLDKTLIPSLADNDS